MIPLWKVPYNPVKILYFMQHFILRDMKLGKLYFSAVLSSGEVSRSLCMDLRKQKQSQGHMAFLFLKGYTSPLLHLITLTDAAFGFFS